MRSLTQALKSLAPIALIRAQWGKVELGRGDLDAATRELAAIDALQTGDGKAGIDAQIAEHARTLRSAIEAHRLN